MLKAKNVRPLLQRYQQPQKNSGQGVKTLRPDRSQCLRLSYYVTNADAVNTPEGLTCGLSDQTPDTHNRGR